MRPFSFPAEVGFGLLSGNFLRIFYRFRRRVPAAACARTNRHASSAARLVFPLSPSLAPFEEVRPADQNLPASFQEGEPASGPPTVDRREILPEESREFLFLQYLLLDHASLPSLLLPTPCHRPIAGTATGVHPSSPPLAALFSARMGVSVFSCGLSPRGALGITRGSPKVQRNRDCPPARLSGFRSELARSRPLQAAGSQAESGGPRLDSAGAARN